MWKKRQVPEGQASREVGSEWAHDVGEARVPGLSWCSPGQLREFEVSQEVGTHFTLYDKGLLVT